MIHARRGLLAIASAIAALAAAAGAADHIQVRGGLPNLCRMLTAKQRTRIMYVGGGTTAGVGASSGGRSYRAILTRHLRRTFPKVSIAEYNRGLAGADSWLAAFRTNTEVVRHYIPLGLVVIEFACDDAAAPRERVIAALEGIIRQVRRKHTAADILFLYGMANRDMATLQTGRLPEVIGWHERVAEHYNIPSVSVAQFVAMQVMERKLKFSDFSKNGVYPTDKGHALFLEAIKPLIAECKAAAANVKEPVKYKLPKPLSPRPMDKAQLVPYEQATLTPGWLDWQLSPLSRFFHVVHCDTPGPVMTLQFTGDTVGIYHVVGPDTGDLEFDLDAAGWQALKCFDERAKAGHYARGQLIAENLDPEKTHTLKLRVAAQTPAGSTGRHARVAFFLVNGRAVYDSPYKGLIPVQRIDKIYATMPQVRFTPAPDRWRFIPKTMQRLREGPELRIVMLGDSIVNDTAGSEYEHLLMRLYPKCKVKKIRSVRGSTGCWWYKDDSRVEPYVLRHKPHLLMIGGISQRGDVDAIREVIHQVRAAQPEVEFFLMTGAFGSKDPRKDPTWSPTVDPKGDGYRSKLMRLAAEEKVEFLDMRGPWGQYIHDSKEQALGSFKRDVVHANQRGKQILGRILELYFSPK